MQFRYWKNKDRKWYWHLQGSNREIVCQSEPYNSKRAMMDTIKEIKRVVGYAEVFPKRTRVKQAEY